jgi:hypothetical protein
VNPNREDSDIANRGLHQLSRQWHILLQDLTDAEQQLCFLEESYEKFVNAFPAAREAYERGANREVWRMDDSMRYLKRRLRQWVGWVGNYRDRTNIQINFVSLARLSERWLMAALMPRSCSIA